MNHYNSTAFSSVEREWAVRGFTTRMISEPSQHLLVVSALSFPHGKRWPRSWPQRVLGSRFGSTNQVASHARHVCTFMTHRHGSLHLNTAQAVELATSQCSFMSLESMILGTLDFAWGGTSGEPSKISCEEEQSFQHSNHFCLWFKKKKKKD